MTPEQEAALVKLLAEATPRPWPKDYVLGAVRHIDRNVDRDAFYTAASEQDFFSWDRRTDGPLILAAVNLLPALLEERRALKEAPAALLREDMGGRDPVSARTQAELDAESALALAARPVGE